MCAALVEGMFFTGPTPWHGLGIQLPDDPSLDDAIRAAGLDWTVRTEPLYRGILDASGATVLGPEVKAKVTIRESDEKQLGIVKPGYTVLQNRDAFAWMAPFLEKKQVKLEVAGSLRKGKHVFILARVVSIDPSEVVKGDPVLAYLLLANGHDGSLAVWIGFTPIRVVCANTLSAALDDENSKLLRIIHTAQVKENLDLVRDTIDIARRQFQTSVEMYKMLASRDIDKTMLRAYVKKVFFPKLEGRKNKDMREIESKASDKIFDKVLPLFEAGRGNALPGVSGTWWAAVNGVNEYLGYVRGRSQDSRLDSLFFGNAANLNKRALVEAVRMAA